jgi:hypothetical protein
MTAVNHMPNDSVDLIVIFCFENGIFLLTANVLVVSFNFFA